MKSTIFLTVSIWILILASCSEVQKKGKECAIEIKQLLNKDSNRLEVNYREKGIVTQLVDKTRDSFTFGAYYFYPNGILQSYKFFALPSKYQFNVQYDSVGNIVLMEGSPLVLHMFRIIDSSTVRFTFLFSSLQTAYENVDVRSSTGIHFKPKLFDNAVFTNMKSTTFDLTEGKSSEPIEIFTTCEIINSCLNKTWTLRDTFQYPTNGARMRRGKK